MTNYVLLATALFVCMNTAAAQRTRAMRDPGSAMPHYWRHTRWLDEGRANALFVGPAGKIGPVSA